MRLTAPELAERALAARAQYADCVLCGHRCEVDRTHGPAGFCQEGDGVFVAGAGVHFGEEQALVGPGWNGRARPPGVRAGSGLVLMGGCNLACRSCETAEFSLERKGVVAASPEQLAGVFLELQEKGARNLNLVTPTHVLPALLEALARAASRGFSMPVVWNCGGYETREALELLDGVVDVYLPDAKVGDDAQGEKLLGCRGYTGALRESLVEMQRQMGPVVRDADGVITRGLIVRHLVLPNGAANPEAVMKLIAGSAPDAIVNVMSQYRPVHEARRLVQLNRRPTKSEVKGALDAARAAGLPEVWLDGTRAPPVAGTAS